jgi:hypothetical protein
MATPVQDLAELAQMQRQINDRTTAELKVSAPVPPIAVRETAHKTAYYYSKNDGRPTYGKGELPHATRAKPPGGTDANPQESTPNTK